jgi:hypothetical protein
MRKHVNIKEEHFFLTLGILILVIGLFTALVPVNITGNTVNYCHKSLPGSWSYCSDTCPCDVGEGDCDGSHDCKLGLKCYDNKGVDFGLESWVDVCVDVDTYYKYQNDLPAPKVIILE